MHQLHHGSSRRIQCLPPTCSAAPPAPCIATSAQYCQCLQAERAAAAIPAIHHKHSLMLLQHKPSACPMHGHPHPSCKSTMKDIHTLYIIQQPSPHSPTHGVSSFSLMPHDKSPMHYSDCLPPALPCFPHQRFGAAFAQHTSTSHFKGTIPSTCNELFHHSLRLLAVARKR